MGTTCISVTEVTMKEYSIPPRLSFINIIPSAYSLTDLINLQRLLRGFHYRSNIRRRLSQLIDNVHTGCKENQPINKLYYSTRTLRAAEAQLEPFQYDESPNDNNSYQFKEKVLNDESAYIGQWNSK